MTPALDLSEIEARLRAFAGAERKRQKRPSTWEADLADQAADTIAALLARVKELEGALRWRNLAEEEPKHGDLVIATDGEARWMDTYCEGLPMQLYLRHRPHVATFWMKMPSDLPALSPEKRSE